MRTLRISLASTAVCGLSIAMMLASCQDVTSGHEPGLLAKVVITPAETTIHVGESAIFSAQATDSNSRPRPNDRVSWSSDASLISASPGQFSATALGRHAVYATSGMVLGTAFVNVVPHGRILGAQHESPYALTLIDTDGSHFRVIGPATGVGFAWMPSGSDLVFLGQGTIQLIDTLGVIRPFFPSGLPGVTSIADPKVSADGQWLYFLGKDSTISPSDWGFYRARIDGAQPELVTSVASTYQFCSDCRVAHVQDISVSPDGTRIVLFLQNSEPNIVIMDVATKTFTFPTIITSGGITWSPDGNHFAYNCLHCLMNGMQMWNAPGTTSPPYGENDHNCCLVWSSDARYLLSANWANSDTVSYETIADVTTGVSARIPSTATAYRVLAFRVP